MPNKLEVETSVKAVFYTSDGKLQLFLLAASIGLVHLVFDRHGNRWSGGYLPLSIQIASIPTNLSIDSKGCLASSDSNKKPVSLQALEFDSKLDETD